VETDGTKQLVIPFVAQEYGREVGIDHRRHASERETIHFDGTRRGKKRLSDFVRGLQLASAHAAPGAWIVNVSVLVHRDVVTRDLDGIHHAVYSAPSMR
jgi:hypothetical protein